MTNVSSEFEATVGLPWVILAFLPMKSLVLHKQHLFILVLSSLLSDLDFYSFLKVHGLRYSQKGRKEYVYSDFILLISLKGEVFKTSTFLLHAFMLIARYNNTVKISSNSLDSFYWFQMESKNISYLCCFIKCLTVKHVCNFLSKAYYEFTILVCSRREKT